MQLEQTHAPIGINPATSQINVPVCNQIIKWKEDSIDRFERVLWIEGNELVTIELDTESGLPRWLSIAEINAAIASGEATIETADRWLPYTDFVAISPIYQKKAKLLSSRRHDLQNDAWNLIKQLVDPPNDQ